MFERWKATATPSGSCCSFLQQTTGKAPTALHTLDMDAPAILRFLDHLESQRHNQAQSRNVRLAAVHSFFRMVAIRDPASVGVATRVLAIPAKRTDKRLLGYLSRPEMDALLNGHDLSQWAGRRDHALLLTLYNTGARVSEMTGLQRSQVQFGTKSFVQFKGKGRKERAAPLWPSTSRTLQSWFAELDADARYRAAVAFPNARGAALSRDGVLLGITMDSRFGTENLGKEFPSGVTTEFGVPNSAVTPLIVTFLLAI